MCGLLTTQKVQEERALTAQKEGRLQWPVVRDSTVTTASLCRASDLSRHEQDAAGDYLLQAAVLHHVGNI